MNIVQLRERFLSGLERRLVELNALLNERPEPEPIMRRFHSLVGIGGTYGFHAITDISRECEELCVCVMDEHRNLIPAELEQLHSAVMRMRRVPTTLAA